MECNKNGTSILQGTKYFGLEYNSSKNFKLVGYSDAYFSRHVYDRTSTLGYLLNMGSDVVSWTCKKGDIVTNSIA